MTKLIHIALIILISVSFSCKEKVGNTKVSEVVTEVKNDIERIEPPNWWVGFKNQQLQLLVKHPNISEAKASIKYPGVSIDKAHKTDSPNYLFLGLSIAEHAKAGQFNIYFDFKNGTQLVQTYQLKDRESEAADIQGFDSSDAIYLITPDRFCKWRYF